MTVKTDENGIAKTLEIGNGGGSGWRRRRWAALLLLVAIAAAAAWFFLKGNQKSAATQYKTEEVRRGDLTVIVTATGTLKPTNSVDRQRTFRNRQERGGGL